MDVYPFNVISGLPGRPLSERDFVVKEKESLVFHIDRPAGSEVLWDICRVSFCDHWFLNGEYRELPRIDRVKGCLCFIIIRIPAVVLEDPGT